jgi:RHS repeat-associated protein
VDGAGNLQVYHTDGLGSIRASTNGAGAVTQTYTTDAFGVPTQTQGTSAQPFQFTGQQHDGTGLYYLRARMYDPTLGRFLSRDPLVGSPLSPLSLNRYSYALNNPLALADPSGLSSNKVTGDGLTDNECFSTANGAFGGYVVNAACFDAPGGVRVVMAAVVGPGGVPYVVQTVVFAKPPGQGGGTGPGNDPYEVAKSGGRNAGLLRTFASKSVAEIQRGIRSLTARAAEHLDKAANPEKYVADWASMDPRQQQGLIRFYQKEAENYSTQAEVLAGLLRDKGGAP